jgi:hypothetical protein
VGAENVKLGKENIFDMDPRSGGVDDPDNAVMEEEGEPGSDQ